jgi:hypothetical protein
MLMSLSSLDKRSRRGIHERRAAWGEVEEKQMSVNKVILIGNLGSNSADQARRARTTNLVALRGGSVCAGFDAKFDEVWARS